MWPMLLLTIYCLLVGTASLLGGWLPSLIRLTHTRMQLMMSFVGGLMMGVALLQLLPHAFAEEGSEEYAAWASVLGLLAMFFLIRILHVHGHEPHKDGVGHEHPAPACSGHEDSVGLETDGSHAHGLGWIGLFIGFAVHTLIDGVALAASVAASSPETRKWALMGVGTFLAVLMHKPLDALAITSVMLTGGWSDRWRSAVNACFALMCPLGALVFYLGIQNLTGADHSVVPCSLGFAAGAFLCISLADVLPEVQFHRHDRWKLSAALLLGIALAWSIGWMEPEHAHSPSHRPSPNHAMVGDPQADRLP
jgi:zinc and cadmium transporter